MKSSSAIAGFHSGEGRDQEKEGRWSLREDSGPLPTATKETETSDI